MKTKRVETVCPFFHVQGTWRRIWSEWFPTAGYESVPGISFEMYYGLASHQNVMGEIWVPVRKK